MPMIKYRGSTTQLHKNQTSREQHPKSKVLKTMKVVSVNLAMQIQYIYRDYWFTEQTKPLVVINHKANASHSLYTTLDLYRPSLPNQFFHHYLPSNLLKRSK